MIAAVEVTKAIEAFDDPVAARSEQRRVKPILYFDDGIERTMGPYPSPSVVQQDQYH